MHKDIRHLSLAAVMRAKLRLSTLQLLLVTGWRCKSDIIDKLGDVRVDENMIDKELV